MCLSWEKETPCWIHLTFSFASYSKAEGVSRLGPYGSEEKPILREGTFLPLALSQADNLFSTGSLLMVLENTSYFLTLKSISAICLCICLSVFYSEFGDQVQHLIFNLYLY